MGTRSREKPERLAEKLRQIRIALGLSQPEMLKQLGVEERIPYNEISKYELGLREPTLIILLQYARTAGVHTEVLIDDDLELPDKLPATTNHEEIRGKYISRRKRRMRGPRSQIDK